MQNDQEQEERRHNVITNDARSAQNMIRKKLAKHPPSEYSVGDKVLIRVDSKSRRLKSGGRKVQQVKARKATIVVSNLEKYRYRVQLDDGTLHWVSVSDITSITQREEKERRMRRRDTSEPKGIREV